MLGISYAIISFVGLESISQAPRRRSAPLDHSENLHRLILTILISRWRIRISRWHAAVHRSSTTTGIRCNSGRSSPTTATTGQSRRALGGADPLLGAIAALYNLFFFLFFHRT